MAEIVEPDLPIVDTHHHLWRRPSWVYDASDFIADTRCGHHVVGSVAVEAQVAGASPGDALSETIYARRMAESGLSPGLCGAIVGFVDLAGAEVEAALAAQVEAAGGRLRGIRQKAAWHADPTVHAPRLNPHPNLLASEDFLRGFAALKRSGLLFEAFVYHPQLPDVAELAARFPETTIVLEHAGCPLLCLARTGQDYHAVLREWRRHLTALARHSNVVMKISGLGMPVFAAPGQAAVEIWRQVTECCLETFGAARCMLGSNFPVDRQSVDYGEVWNRYKRFTASCTINERRKIFSENALSLYGTWGLTSAAQLSSSGFDI